MSTESKFMRVQAVADLLDVSEWTVRRMCEAGTLAYVQPGRAIRITRASVEALIKGATQNTAAA